MSLPPGPPAGPQPPRPPVLPPPRPKRTGFQRFLIGCGITAGVAFLVICALVAIAVATCELHFG